MTDFLDTENRIWNFSLTLGTARFVAEKTGVNLLNPAEVNADGQQLITRLMYDDLLFGTVVVALLDNQGVTPADVDGAFLKCAEGAFWEEYRLFFADRGKSWAAAAIRAGLAEREENAKQAETMLAGATSSN